MITKNGKVYLIAGWLNSQSLISRTFKTTEGDTLSVDNDVLNKMRTIWETLYAKVGSGTTEPTVNDIDITETDSLTVTSQSNTLDRGGTGYFYYDDNYIQGASVVVRNNTESDITVNEIGLYSALSGDEILLARDVITPVLIAPNKTYSFSITLL